MLVIPTRGCSDSMSVVPTRLRSDSMLVIPTRGRSDLMKGLAIVKDDRHKNVSNDDLRPKICAVKGLSASFGLAIVKDDGHKDVSNNDLRPEVSAVEGLSAIASFNKILHLDQQQQQKQHTKYDLGEQPASQKTTYINNDSTTDESINF
jgi:hypothetical protein